MNILAISSLLPVPEIVKSNDFVFQIYKHNNQLNENDKVVIIKPIKYDFNLSKIIGKSTKLSRLNNNYSITIQNFQVEIFPFLSTWSFRNIHSILTSSIYYLNKRRLDTLFSIHNFDVIHAQYIFPDGILAYLLHKKYNIPYFLTSHNERFYLDHFLSRKIALNIMKNANEVLPINHTNYLFYKYMGVKNMEVLPLGFNKTFIRPQKSFNSELVSIFTAAQIIKLKNIDKVLLALKTIKTECNFKYTIIGTGPEKESLIRLTKELDLDDSVTFIDQIPHDQIAGEMYKHDIFIMTSFFETFGRVYFEAMAMGIPVICAKDSGISGLFKEMEEGISVDHNNIDEIAAALKFLITNNDERLRIGRNGQNLVNGYTWENIVKILHAKYIKATSRIFLD